jgi:hypothetical protein
MVFRYESDVNGLRIGLPFFEPEEMVFANTKTFQVRVSVFAFVVWKSCDPKWLQSLGVESNRTLEVTDCENNVIYHISLSVLVGRVAQVWRVILNLRVPHRRWFCEGGAFRFARLT